MSCIEIITLNHLNTRCWLPFKSFIECPLNDKPIIFVKKLEIIILSGYIRTTESHLHISASDENCSVFGRHLLSGSIVLKSLDA